MRSLTSSVDTCEAARVIRCPIADLHSLPHTFSFIIPHRKGFGITIAKERMLEINPMAEVHLFGQELNGETFALCKSDLYMKSADGRDAENIKFGSTLSKDQHADKHFDYLL